MRGFNGISSLESAEPLQNSNMQSAPIVSIEVHLVDRPRVDHIGKSKQKGPEGSMIYTG